MRPLLTILALLVCAGCKPPRDPRAVERLVPLSASPQPDRDPSPSADPARPAVRPHARDAGVLRVVSDRPEPAAALGVRFGMTRAEVSALNRAAAVNCRDADEYMFCGRALVPVRTEVVATYEFCADRLCSVALDGTRTRDEGRIASDYLVLTEIARAELGAPSAEAHHVAPGCAGHLALCLASKQAEYTTRWTWHQGFQAMVSADQDETDAFMAQVSVTYLTGERARRPEPPAPATPTHIAADASTDAAPTL